MLGNKRYIYCMEDDRRREENRERESEKYDKEGVDNSIVYATRKMSSATRIKSGGKGKQKGGRVAVSRQADCKLAAVAGSEWVPFFHPFDLLLLFPFSLFSLQLNIPFSLPPPVTHPSFPIHSHSTTSLITFQQKKKVQTKKERAHPHTTTLHRKVKKRDKRMRKTRALGLVH